MAGQVYENWWMHLTEPNCGIYYRGRWYATESALNAEGYYVVYNVRLYLGEYYDTYKYQNVYYLFGENDYRTYGQVHALGYSTNRSWSRHYINKNTQLYKTGYYNPTDGYFVEGVWYATLQDLNTAGYEVGTDHNRDIYGKSVFHRYDTITKKENDITYYFSTDSEQWYTDSQFDDNDKSWFPSIETNWTIGQYWTGNSGHGYHDTYSINYDRFTRHSVVYYKNDMDTLVGYQENNTEYDICGTFVGDSYYPNNIGSLVGYKLYFEYNSNRGYPICSVYSPNNSAFGSNQNLVSIAVALNRDAVDVVKIYDEANFAFNAFKYRLNGVDYYYILDNAHDWWVTDVTQEGYTLTERLGVRSIYAVYGTEITPPLGYEVVKAVGNCLNVFPSYVGIEEDTGYLVIAYEGKDVCQKNVAPWMIRKLNAAASGYVEVPVLKITQITSVNTSVRPTGQATDTTGGIGTNGYLDLVDVKVNGTDPVYGDYFILLKTTSTSYRSYFELGLPARLWFTLNNGWALHEFFFYEPRDTFSLDSSTATFSWTGNPTDTSEHAYWQYTDYHGASSGDHCYKFFLYANNEADRITTVHLLCVDGTQKSVEYWPHNGYKIGDTLYTEQQLRNLGYYISRPTRQVVADVSSPGRVLACYNVTRNSKSFSSLSSYTHLLTVNDEPLIYDGESDISVISFGETNKVTYLDDMPSSVSSYLHSSYTLYSVITDNSTPYNRFPLSSNRHQLALVACTNYSSDFYYDLPAQVTLSISDNSIPYFYKYIAYKMSDETSVDVYYNSTVGYTIKDIGTFATKKDAYDAGYLVVDKDLYTILYYEDNSSNLYLQGYKTRESTSFDLNYTYCRVLYTDSSLTKPAVYNGTPLVWNIEASGITQDTNNSRYKVTSLSEFPSTTTDDHPGRTDGFFILSATGDPVTPFKESDIGQQLRHYTCSNYQGDLHRNNKYNVVVNSPDITYSTFYLIDAEHILPIFVSPYNVNYYALQSKYYTEQQLHSKGYTRTPSERIYVVNDNTYYICVHNSQDGYYITDTQTWYLTETELNNAGYFVADVNPVTVNLNDSWIELESEDTYDQSIASEAGAGYYVVKSNRDRGVASSQCTMYITINVNNAITFKAMARSEVGYDYVVASLDDNIIFNGQNVSSFSSFTVSNAAGKTLTVYYRKDGSVDTDPDRGYLAIPVMV